MLTDQDLADCSRLMQYEFHNTEFLKEALTHSSCANEQKIRRRKDYERLEFLGDSILEMVSSEYLFQTYPDKREGEMTKLRAAMVCEPSLAYCARQIHLERFLQLGRGEEATGGRGRDSIVSDIMESTIGAVYLDGGFEEARAYILKTVLKDPESSMLLVDSKSVLQEMVQSKGHGDLHYEILSETGPDHDKVFVAAVSTGDLKLGEGAGHNKKAAEQKAAYEAILAIRNKTLCI